MVQIGLLCHARKTRVLTCICMHIAKVTLQWFSRRFTFDCWRTRKTSNPFVVLLIKSSKSKIESCLKVGSQTDYVSFFYSWKGSASSCWICCSEVCCSWKWQTCPYWSEAGWEHENHRKCKVSVTVHYYEVRTFLQLDVPSMLLQTFNQYFGPK